MHPLNTQGVCIYGAEGRGKQLSREWFAGGGGGGQESDSKLIY